jgi:hypothetical protein
MAKITPTHPQMVAEYQEEIMQSLDDSDVSIRMRALELVTSMVSYLFCEPGTESDSLRSTETAFKPLSINYWLI